MNVRRLNSTWDAGFLSIAESNKFVIWGLSVIDGQLGRVVDGGVIWGRAGPGIEGRSAPVNVQGSIFFGCNHD